MSGDRGSMTKAHHAKEPLVGIEHVTVVDRFDLIHLSPQVCDALVDRHLRAEPGKVRVHEAAGCIVGVREQGDDLTPGGRIQLVEQRLPFLPRDTLDRVGVVVQREKPQPEPTLGGRRQQEQSGLVARLHPPGRRVLSRRPFWDVASSLTTIVT